MISAEKKLLYFIEKHIHLLFAGAVLLIGCCMRIAGFHFLSHDAKCYLLKWYDQIAANGISEQVGNYNIPYQLIIYLLTKLPLKPLHAYKVVSCAFDLAMAMECRCYNGGKGRTRMKSLHLQKRDYLSTVFFGLVIAGVVLLDIFLPGVVR